MIMEPGRVKQLEGEISRLKKSLSKKTKEIEKMKVSCIFLETLFDGIHEEIMVVDENYLIQDVNKVFLEHYGLTKEDALKKKCHEIRYQQDNPCGTGKQSCPLEKASKTGRRVEVTHYHELQGGGFRELNRIIYPVVTQGERPKNFVEISRDVTEYRNLIRGLKASEKKFKTILDTATDAILSIDENQKIVLFNNAAQRIFGYSRAEVLGEDLGILIPPQYDDHYRFVRRFLETKEHVVMGKMLSLSAVRKNGEEFPIELGLSHHEMEGKITFTAIIRDVSTQKQLEKNLLQSARLAAVGQAVARVAHEIKNPLMIIGGFSHQLRRGLAEEKAVQKLDMIFDEVSRLEKLVANLGDFTKEYTLLKRRADINSVVTDVVKIMGEIYSFEKYKFKADLCPNLREINCDPDKLKQVFMNIIANGIEAMENGGAIKISTGEWSNGVEISIQDEGSGMSEEELLEVFEPFYTTREKGSGLGLSISYKIVEAHKGEIRATSIPGGGTTFAILLPAS
jgi:two-component system sensor kinase FixL